MGCCQRDSGAASTMGPKTASQALQLVEIADYTADLRKSSQFRAFTPRTRAAGRGALFLQPQ